MGFNMIKPLAKLLAAGQRLLSFFFIRKSFTLSLLVATFGVNSVLRTFSLNRDQTRQNIRPDLNPNCSIGTLMMVIPKEYFENVNSKKKSANDIKSMQNYPMTISDIWINRSLASWDLLYMHWVLNTDVIDKFDFHMSNGSISFISINTG